MSLDLLDERSKRIIQLRFGLLDGKPRNLNEVALIWGITPEAVSRIEKKAIRDSGLKPSELYRECYQINAERQV